ncbi:MAG: hypothetical protein IID37_05760, partial [Planctomycetes bacterium]|nr:hypothetical protein [Planctomycetota bacterium]
GAILKFNANDPLNPKALLDGAFEIRNNGTLNVASGGFQTNGTLRWKGGTIDVAASAIADFGECPGGSCS